MNRRNSPQDNEHSTAVTLLLGAAVLGGITGIGTVAMSSGGRDAIAAIAKDTGVAAGVVRERAPQAGDNWGGCNDARAAGTAPIYRGEPGYRTDMDGDGDGIACEPQY